MQAWGEASHWTHASGHGHVLKVALYPLRLLKYGTHLCHVFLNAPAEFPCVSGFFCQRAGVALKFGVLFHFQCIKYGVAVGDWRVAQTREAADVNQVLQIKNSLLYLEILT